jgi:hypothetical protein
MLQRVLVQVAGQPERELSLDRPGTAGGSHADTVHLAGLPAGALELAPAAAGLLVTARVAGARAAGHPLAAGVRRLLRPGERVEVQGASLALAPARPADTTRVAAAGLLAQAAAGVAPVAGLHLVVLTGPAAGARLPLGPDETLGRGRPATLRIADPRASRRHARLRVAGGAVTVEDLGSKNGLRVNGVRADRGPVPLLPGDELVVGETALALGDPLAPTRSPEPAPAAAAAAPGRSAAPPPRVPRTAQAAAALLALAAALALAGL